MSFSNSETFFDILNDSYHFSTKFFSFKVSREKSISSLIFCHKWLFYPNLIVRSWPHISNLSIFLMKLIVQHSFNVCKSCIAIIRLKKEIWFWPMIQVFRDYIRFKFSSFCWLTELFLLQKKYICEKIISTSINDQHFSSCS